MTLSITLSAFVQGLALSFFLHPIHVSVTEIEFDKKDQALEIMMRVFIDDLELAMRHHLNKPEFDILNPGKNISLDALAAEYLDTHFKISLDGRPQKTVYLGHEREAEAFIFYIEVGNVRTWNTITVQNNIIMSTYDDQSNIVHVFVNDKVKSLRLTRNTPIDKLTFDNR